MSKIWKIQSIATPKRQENISCYEVHVANPTQSAIPKWDLNISQPSPKDGFHPLPHRPWQIDGLCVSSEVQATYLHVEFQTWQWTGHQHQIIQFHDFPTYKLPFSLWIFKLQPCLTSRRYIFWSPTWQSCHPRSSKVASQAALRAILPNARLLRGQDSGQV